MNQWVTSGPRSSGMTREEAKRMVQLLDLAGFETARAVSAGSVVVYVLTADLAEAKAHFFPGDVTEPPTTLVRSRRRGWVFRWSIVLWALVMTAAATGLLAQSTGDERETVASAVRGTAAAIVLVGMVVAAFIRAVARSGRRPCPNCELTVDIASEVCRFCGAGHQLTEERPPECWAPAAGNDVGDSGATSERGAAMGGSARGTGARG